MNPDASSPDAVRQDLLDELGAALRLVVRSLEGARERTAKDLALHPTDFACIGYLHRAGAVSPREVIAHLGLTSSSGTALFDRLEADGYIQRMPNPNDRRSILLTLDRNRAESVIARYVQIELAFTQVIERFETGELASIVRFLRQFSTVTEALGQR